MHVSKARTEEQGNKSSLESTRDTLGPKGFEIRRYSYKNSGGPQPHSGLCGGPPMSLDNEMTCVFSLHQDSMKRLSWVKRILFSFAI
jgi:hypothetical protein